jgi:putative SOS response-associated peptidase YedK
MCGRFTLKTPVIDWLFDLFPHLDRGSVQSMTDGLPKGLLLPRFNIAPTQSVLVLTLADRVPSLRSMRWGLVPSWADSASMGYSMINARVETLRQKPSFKPSLSGRRCVVISDGYYEWKKLGAKEKEPYWIHQDEERPFGMAGLWAENSKIDQSKPLYSTSIITTPANAETVFVHDRMPAILSNAEQMMSWFDAQIDLKGDDLDCGGLFAPAPCGQMKLRRVGNEVGNVKNDAESLIQPIQSDQ